jgi:TfoX/Sxy family transcriptional regulator of competence genes
VSSIASVAYDEELANRIRAQIADEANLTERQMFGGLAFLVGGNMAVAASGQGGLLVRVDPDQTDDLVSTTNANRMEMRGREMDGWLRVGAGEVGDDSELARWVRTGVEYARSLRAKQ